MHRLFHKLEEISHPCNLYIKYTILEKKKLFNHYSTVKRVIAGPYQCKTRDDIYRIYDSLRSVINHHSDGIIKAYGFDTSGEKFYIEFSCLDQLRHFLFNCLTGDTHLKISPMYRKMWSGC